MAAVVLSTALVACRPGIPGAPACATFPADSVWHAPVTHLPVLANSTQLVASTGTTSPVHADFGSGLWDGGPIGIPFTTVSGTQAKVRMVFDVADESDPGPYPIPATAPIEGGSASDGDRHVIVVDRDRCQLYELYDAHRQSDGSWHAYSGAHWNLASDALRPANWTSGDAAGLPILPGLLTYDEVHSGVVDHAIRITVPTSRRSYLWPARHEAGSTNDANTPAMGQRFRLKSSIDPTSFPASVRPIIVALQTYGGIVADNGTAWYLGGAPDPRWNNDDLHTLGRLTGRDFQAVDGTKLEVSANSGAARPPA